MKKEISKVRCECTRHRGDCITCEQDCPYPMCQHENCMACKNRMKCPMCSGECKRCEYQSICKILRLREEEP